MSRDDDVKQALGQVAKLGGFQIKRMATTDDLKDHTITITITRPSEGWHQERLQFEDEQPMTATVNGRGEVEDLKIEHADTGDPDDYNEVETIAQAETTNPAASVTVADTENTSAAGLHIEPDGTVAEGAEQEGTLVELAGKKRK